MSLPPSAAQAKGLDWWLASDGNKQWCLLSQIALVSLCPPSLSSSLLPWEKVFMAGCLFFGRRVLPGVGEYSPVQTETSKQAVFSIGTAFQGCLATGRQREGTKCLQLILHNWSRYKFHDKFNRAIQMIFSMASLYSRGQRSPTHHGHECHCDVFFMIYLNCSFLSVEWFDWSAIFDQIFSPDQPVCK